MILYVDNPKIAAHCLTEPGQVPTWPNLVQAAREVFLQAGQLMPYDARYFLTLHEVSDSRGRVALTTLAGEMP